MLGTVAWRRFSREARARFLELSTKSEAKPHVPSAETSETIKELTDEVPPPRPANKPISKGSSAVLIPLVSRADHGDSVLFTKRSLLLKDHRGEICFPGGRVENDESLEEAATRELEEEIGIRASLIDIWGQMHSVPTRQNGRPVTPIVGEIREDHLSSIKPNHDEVDSVFTVPIDELVRSTEYTVFSHNKVLYTMPIFRVRKYAVLAKTQDSRLVEGREVRVWGLTSVMLHFFLLHMFPGQYSNRLAPANFFRVRRL
ncbi:unnamed protein product, partial [Mesorhabditis spiculigera]